MVVLADFLLVGSWTIFLIYASMAFFYKNKIIYFLAVSAFLIPFYSISFGIDGFQFSIYKILPLLLLIISIRYQSGVPRQFIQLAIFFIGITLISFFISLTWTYFDDVKLLGRVVDSMYARPLIQCILFVISIGQMWYISKLPDLNFERIVSWYVYGCAALVLIGYVQLFCYFADIPWFDFWWLRDSLGRTAENGMASHAYDRGFYRMSSLGGEPRHFASFVCIGILTCIHLRATCGKRLFLITGASGFALLAFLLSGVLLSVSSSGCLVLMMGLLGYFFFKSAGVFTLLVAVIVVLLNISDIGIIDAIKWKVESIDMLLYAAPKDAICSPCNF